ncbi:hypothetical protein BBAD15_g12147 [Beauveria bassiana D1-5]|uniref:Uncharacterized protein n=1 Tax=Beauveria bassiana D1-5 TaxID=1245745 RepID=A0A0A2VP91_BEABA|nr:hypothetical protein BBAD15_g12147 [Beauveria bassiana D1-5]
MRGPRTAKQILQPAFNSEKSAVSSSDDLPTESQDRVTLTGTVTFVLNADQQASRLAPSEKSKTTTAKTRAPASAWSSSVPWATPYCPTTYGAARPKKTNHNAKPPRIQQPCTGSATTATLAEAGKCNAPFSRNSSSPERGVLVALHERSESPERLRDCLQIKEESKDKTCQHLFEPSSNHVKKKKHPGKEGSTLADEVQVGSLVQGRDGPPQIYITVANEAQVGRVCNGPTVFRMSIGHRGLCANEAITASYLVSTQVRAHPATFLPGCAVSLQSSTSPVTPVENASCLTPPHYILPACIIHACSAHWVFRPFRYMISAFLAIILIPTSLGLLTILIVHLAGIHPKLYFDGLPATSVSPPPQRLRGRMHNGNNATLSRLKMCLHIAAPVVIRPPRIMHHQRDNPNSHRLVFHTPSTIWPTKAAKVGTTTYLQLPPKHIVQK